jgi:isoamylase
VVLLNGRTLDDVNSLGEPIRDATFLILLNPHHESVRFTLPAPHEGTIWTPCVDTRGGAARAAAAKPRGAPRKFYQLIPRSLAILREVSITAKPGMQER